MAGSDASTPTDAAAPPWSSDAGDASGGSERDGGTSSEGGADSGNDGGVNSEGGVDSGDGAMPTATCTGKAGAPGLTMRTIEGRNVLVYIPTSVNPNRPVPLVLVHHGFLMDGEGMRATTGFQAIADREGFAVAFPSGTGATWNVGEGACGGVALVAGTSDDLTLVKSMISSIEQDQCLSREHVFMTGFSMGGYFSNHAGCQLHGVIRAVAPHSSGTYPDACPGGPTPVMLWHGSTDTTVGPDCGRNARDLWIKRNGCQTTFDSVPVQNGTCEWYKGCPPQGQVVLCTMNGLGHQWSGGSGLIGAPNYENASELSWKFFKEQSGL